MEQSYLEIGKVTNTHGLKGEVKVVPWADDPCVFERLKNVYLKTRQPLSVVRVRYQKGNLIVKFLDIDAIEQAEHLKNQVLLVRRSDLDTLPKDTYYIADLIGLAVIADGETLGSITDVFQYGGADLYAISRENKKDLLLPATKETILEVNLEAGYVRVSIPDGLLDLSF